MIKLGEIENKATPSPNNKSINQIVTFVLRAPDGFLPSSKSTSGLVRLHIMWSLLPLQPHSSYLTLFNTFYIFKIDFSSSYVPFSLISKP